MEGRFVAGVVRVVLLPVLLLCVLRCRALRGRELSLQWAVGVRKISLAQKKSGQGWSDAFRWSEVNRCTRQSFTGIPTQITWQPAQFLRVSFHSNHSPKKFETNRRGFASLGCD